MTIDTDTLRREIRAHLPDRLPLRLGVAVSGGSDSTALLYLLAEISRQEGIVLFAATVDHGLRPEAAEEARTVAALARRLSIPHQTLTWRGWDGTGNLQDAARRARYGLLTRWAREQELPAIALGHTADDQAETVLMRLSRSAGISGLSAMANLRTEGGVDLLRPMLSITRARLQSYLMQSGLEWIEDPSNQDQRFERIKVRKALAQLEPLGITADTLSRVAENLTQAREALAQYAQDSARRVVRVDGGDICIDRDSFGELPEEIRRRIIVAAVVWIAGAGYPPRHSAVDRALHALTANVTLPIGGCLLVPNAENMWICRELKPVSEKVSSLNEPWDNRWVVTGPNAVDAQVRALGEDGLLQLSDWRALGKPRKALLATPAVWAEDTLLAAPLAGFCGEWRIKMSENRPEFFSSILSH